MQKLIKWFKNNFWLIIACFLLVFIPLYPKIPLVHVIRTWVYIRLEDVFVAVSIGFLLLNFFVKRKIPKTPLNLPILIYWLAGLITVVTSLLFIAPKLVGFFPHLEILHYLRRFEYMLLFFIGFLALRENPKALKIVIWTLGITAMVVVVYGIGQKYLGWPAFLTMNEEFAKGIPLRLPPTARIASTFGGHYDLAAYLVFLLPLFISLLIIAPFLWQKALLFILIFGLFILLLYTASRTSFFVYLIGGSVIFWWQKKKWAIVPFIIISIIGLNLVSGTSERFLKTFRFTNVIVDLSTGKSVGTLDKLEGTSAISLKDLSPAVETLPTGSGFVGVANTGPTTPSKIVKTVELFKSQDLASGSGEVATISGSFLIQKALVYDISITTRFQGEWPLAIQAFKRDILFGSGFSTLSVATDGDYHRMLGETGLVGMVTFMGVFLMAFVTFLRVKDNLTIWEKGFVIGVFGGIVALLFNAILIDVFEASKVAFTLWLVLGFAMSIIALKVKEELNYLKLLKRTLINPIALLIYLVIIVILVYSSGLNNYFTGDDFTWLKWAAQSSFKDLWGYFTNASGFFYRPIPKLWYFTLFSIFWLVPQAYHIMSLAVLSVTIIALNRFMHRFGVRQWLNWGLCLLFGILAVHHENVFWISGQSNLLSAMFLMLSLVIFQGIWQKKLTRFVYQILAYICLFLSQISYEGSLIAPLIIYLIGFFFYKQTKIKSLLPLVLIPVYWIIRFRSGAVNPSGDYGYNLAALPINFVSNSIAYLLAIPFGPKVIELFSSLREAMRVYKQQIIIAASAVLVILIAVIYKLKKKLYLFKDKLVWLVIILIALLPYLGLGGIDERYAFTASIFWIIMFGVTAETINKKKLICQILTGIVIILLIGWNYQETNRLSTDWKKASSVSEQTLLTIKKQFFPLTFGRTFIFINTPIRYGRAWIFPTGLGDALWHIYRDAPYAVAQAATPKQAHAILTPPQLAPEFLIFENYVLKKSIVETQIIEE